MRKRKSRKARVVFNDEDSERIRLAVIEWVGPDVEKRMLSTDIARLKRLIGECKDKRRPKITIDDASMTYKFRTSLTQYLKDLENGPPSTDSDD